MLALLVALVGVTAGELVNIAPQGSIFASSVGWGGVPTRAIDKNTDGYWRGRSCYHSASTRNSELTLELPGADLGASWPVDSVKVFNRLDSCCDERIQGAEVWLDNHMCGPITFTQGKEAYEVDCGGRNGTSVTVKHNFQYLQVCELQVFVKEEDIPTDIPSYINVALNGTASASSIAHGGAAQRVIDGNRNGFWGGRSCYHSSGASTTHVVTVTLPAGIYAVKYPVSYINIYNRLDSCCDQRINGAMVFADDHQCGQLQFREGKPMYRFDCGEHPAGEVSVRLSNGQSLQICELEVLVLKENMPTHIPKFINVALNGTASASSIAHGGVAQRVIDGNTNGRWVGRSCYHSSGASTTHVVTVTLPAGMYGVKYPVSYINIYNRLDSCCDQRINGAMVYVDDHQCGQVQFREGQAVYTFDCGEYEGGEVSVRLSNGQSLQICELEVLVLGENMPDNIPVFTNVALNRPTSQSSVGAGGVPSRAVDGNTNQYYGGRSCTHTSSTRDNWWKVQLDQEEYVQSVVIYNRLDCCSNRISGSQVWIGSGETWELCGTVNYDTNSSPIITMSCMKTGDKVKITNNNSYLTLCEVQIMVPEEIPSEIIDEE